MTGIRIVPIAEAATVALPKGSWTKMLITREQVGDNTTALGLSLFTGGTVTDMITHRAEELAYVISGRGELRRDVGPPVTFTAGDALFIPAGAWHAVANVGADDLTMVCVFAHPSYPPTERWTAGA